MPISEHMSSINLFSAIIDHISDLAVGVKQIVGIYSSGESMDALSGVCLEYQNNRLQEREIIISGVHQQLKQMQQERNNYKWLDKSQVPFDTHTESQSQLSIFNEYDHLILLITLPHRFDNKKDLIFIYFKDDMDQFGVQHQKSSLSTQNKTIIGHLISSSSISFAKMYWQQEDKLNRLANKSRQIISHQKSDNKDVTRKVELEDLLLSWATEFLTDCSNSDHVNYVYSEDAKVKIKFYHGTFNNLKSAIQEAIEYAKMIITDVNIVIESEYIVFDTNVNTVGTNHKSISVSPRLQKAFDFLDKLENNALKVSKAGLNLTSFNVGLQMERSITPAAISDYISKNRDRINSLFKQYPDRWSYIKNNFRPVVNVIGHDNNDIKKWG